MNPIRHLARWLMAAPLALALTAGAWADTYPSRTVRIIVAYPPGQSTDIATRYFAAKLSTALGQQVIVENRAGAFGNIGTAFAARQTPDGYTLIMGASGTHAINPYLYSNVGFDVEKDFDSIAATAIIPMVISVSPTAGVNSLDDLMKLAKARPDKVDVAIPSVTAQFVLEMLKQRGAPLFAVKYKGSADATTAVLGDQVPVLIDTVAASRAHFGKLKALAVTSPKAMSAFPDIRSAQELGMQGFSVTAWNTLMAPRGTPPAVRDRLAAEMRKILALPETIKTLNDLGFEPAPAMNFTELDAWLKEEREKYGAIIRSANMKVD